MRVTFSFTVRVAEAVTDPLHTCIIRPPTDGNEPCCVDIGWNLDADTTDCGCPTDCDCVTTPLGSQIVDSPSPRVAFGNQICDYSTPLCTQTWACLTTAVSHPNIRPRIRIEAGGTELRNVAVFIWEAVPGLASPNTPTGFEQYECPGNGRPPSFDRPSARSVDGGDRRPHRTRMA